MIQNKKCNKCQKPSPIGKNICDCGNMTFTPYDEDALLVLAKEEVVEKKKNRKEKKEEVVESKEEEMSKDIGSTNIEDSKEPINDEVISEEKKEE